MKSSLFKKQYLRYAFTILICTIVLGASIIGLCTQYFKDTVETDLSISAKLGASAIYDELEEHNGFYVITENIENKFRMISSCPRKRFGRRSNITLASLFSSGMSSGVSLSS